MKPITIIIERGLITAVYADNPDTHIVIIDKDIEGCDHQKTQGDARIGNVYIEAVVPYHLLPEDDAEMLLKTFPTLETDDLS